MKTVFTLLAVWIACVHGSVSRAQGSDAIAERAHAQVEMEAQEQYARALAAQESAQAAQEMALVAQARAFEVHARAQQERETEARGSMRVMRAGQGGDLEARVRELERRLQLPAGGYRENMTLEQRVLALEQRQQSREAPEGGKMMVLSELFDQKRSAEAEGRAHSEAEARAHSLERHAESQESQPRRMRWAAPNPDGRAGPGAPVGVPPSEPTPGGGGVYAPMAPSAPGAPRAPTARWAPSAPGAPSAPDAPRARRAPGVDSPAPLGGLGYVGTPGGTADQRTEMQRQIEQRIQSMRAEMERMRVEMAQLRQELEDARSNPR